MYTPKHFSVSDEDATQMLSAVSAGDLVTATDHGLVATFVPLLVDLESGAHGSLLGHLARSNDQWRRPALGQALVIAHGPDAYVSPSWYASKVEHGRVVPTWNYATVHAHGILTVHDDPDWVDSLVRQLTEREEAGRPHPWHVDDAPARFHAGQLRAIVGIELAISRVEVKVKMSQNRPDADIAGVIAGLHADGQADAADLVERHRRRPDPQ